MKELLSLSAIIDHDSAMRTIAKERIIEILLLGGFAFNVKTQGMTLPTEQATQALDSWILAGLPYSLSATQEQLFDPAEVINFMKWSSLCRGESFWTDHFVPTGQRLFQSIDALSTSQNSLGSAHFSFCRTFNLKGIEWGKKLRLRLPLPQSLASDLTVKVYYSEGQDAVADISQSSQRVECIYQHTDRSSIHISYQFNFDQFACIEPKAYSALTNEERSFYTSPHEGFIQVTDQIKRLSSAITKQRVDSLAVDEIWGWLIDSFFLGVVHYHRIDLANLMDNLIKRKIIDCQLGSALLVSLCRSLGIPARIVGGYLLYPLAPTQHYWAQVWIDGHGWRSYDLMAWDLSAGGKQENWRNIFKGQVDARIMTEIFPRSIVGNVGLTHQGGIHRLVHSAQTGIVIEYCHAKSGSVIYKDEIAMTLAELTT